MPSIASAQLGKSISRYNGTCAQILTSRSADPSGPHVCPILPRQSGTVRISRAERSDRCVALRTQPKGDTCVASLLADESADCRQSLVEDACEHEGQNNPVKP